MPDDAVSIPRRRLRKRWIATGAAVADGCRARVAVEPAQADRRRLYRPRAGSAVASRRATRSSISAWHAAAGKCRHRRSGAPRSHRRLGRAPYGLRSARAASGAHHARGVRLNGRIVDGQAFARPDRQTAARRRATRRSACRTSSVDIADAAMRLDTPAGRIGMSLLGRAIWPAASGAARSPCRASSTPAAVRSSGRSHRCASPSRHAVRSLEGPVRGDRIACGSDLAMQAPLLDLDARLAACARRLERQCAAAGRPRRGAGADRLVRSMAASPSTAMPRADQRQSGAGGQSVPASAIVSSGRLRFDGRYEASVNKRQASHRRRCRGILACRGRTPLRSDRCVVAVGDGHPTRTVRPGAGDGAGARSKGRGCAPSPQPGDRDPARPGSGSPTSMPQPQRRAC